MGACTHPYDPTSRFVGMSMGQLLAQAFGLYRRNLRLVVTLALPVVAVVIGVTALGLGEFSDSYRASLPARDLYIEAAASELVTAPLISSMLARWVLGELRGERMSATDIVAGALEAFPAVLLVVFVWLVISAGGFVVLIVPGIYTFVAWFFVVQAVVIDNDRGLAPIARSGALVRGNWWRTLGVGIVFVVPTGVFTALVGTAFAPLASAANSDAVLVGATVLADTLTLPFLAIGATLYYLQLREQAATATARS
jgi:hypothetical protein